MSGQKIKWRLQLLVESGFYLFYFLILILFFNLILFIFLYSRFLLVIHFIHISVYMSILISQFISLPGDDDGKWLLNEAYISPD